MSDAVRGKAKKKLSSISRRHDLKIMLISNYKSAGMCRISNSKSGILTYDSEFTNRNLGMHAGLSRGTSGCKTRVNVDSQFTK